MAKVFSRETLAKFADACASIPLRALDRAFTNERIDLGPDPGGEGGSRRTQFRRYVANLDQHDPDKLQRLGRALGGLIAEVAASKEAFLITAAEGDGFTFEGGVFKPAATAPYSFAVTRIEDFGSIDERSRRLHLLLDARPDDAVIGARELVESLSRTILHRNGKRASGKKADLAKIVAEAIATLALEPPVEQLGIVVAHLLDPGAGSSSRRARLAVGIAVALANYLAETPGSERAS